MLWPWRIQATGSDRVAFQRGAPAGRLRIPRSLTSALAASALAAGATGCAGARTAPQPQPRGGDSSARGGNLGAGRTARRGRRERGLAAVRLRSPGGGRERGPGGRPGHGRRPGRARARATPAALAEATARRDHRVGRRLAASGNPRADGSCRARHRRQPHPDLGRTALAPGHHRSDRATSPRGAGPAQPRGDARAPRLHGCRNDGRRCHGPGGRGAGHLRRWLRPPGRPLGHLGTVSGQAAARHRGRRRLRSRPAAGRPGGRGRRRRAAAGWRRRPVPDAPAARPLWLSGHASTRSAGRAEPEREYRADRPDCRVLPFAEQRAGRAGLRDHRHRRAGKRGAGRHVLL